MFRQIRSFLKKFLSGNLLILVLMIAMAVAIYLWGNRMGYRGIYPLGDEDMRAFAAVALLFAAACFAMFLVLRWAYRKIRNRRRRAPKEPTVEEIEAGKMDALFATVMKTMKKRWEGKGSPVKNMPWYILLGSEDAGKTSLIENSNMRFPLDNDIKVATKKLGSSEAGQFVDWRISGKEAVFLDIKGRHFTSAQERDLMQNALWDSFLKNLNKVRERKPINGAIIAIDVLDFASSSLEEREIFAEKIRGQLIDIVEKLGSRLPVYIVFTKLDLISGFNEFYSIIPNEERDKIFGFHFIYRQAGEQDWQEQLETQFTGYLDQLIASVSSYLKRLGSQQARREAYAFYRTIYGLEEPLKKFLHVMFDEDKFSTPPLVRGLYFTSVKQENAPENLFLDVVSGRYQLPAPVFATAQGRSRALFSATLFHGQIFPEAELAGRNRKYRRGTMRNRAVAVVFASLVGFLIVGYWITRYDWNVTRGAQLVTDVDEYQYAGLQIDSNTPPEFYLPSLSLARDAALQFPNWRKKSAVGSALTLYQGRRLGPYGDFVYLTALNREYMPALTDTVGDRLAGVCPKGSEEQLRLLQIYRMLGEPDHRDNAAIENFFRTDWQEFYPGDGVTQGALYDHMSFALENSQVSYPTDQTLIQQALNDLGGLSPSQLVYGAMRARANTSLEQTIDLSTAGGANFAYVYENSKEIAASNSLSSTALANNTTGCVDNLADGSRVPLTVQEFYSRHGFRDFFETNINETSELASSILWVFDTNGKVDYSQEDVARIEQSVWGTYAGDYVDAWTKAIDDLRIRQIDNLNAAVVVTESLGSVDSPMRRIAETVTRETVIYDEEDDLDAQEGNVDVAGLRAQSSRIAASDIERSFLAIQDLIVPPAEGQAPKIDAITEASSQLSKFLVRMTNDVEPSKQALRFAIDRANGTLAQDPIENLRRVAEDAPEPFRSQLLQVADQTWSVILNEASYALNARWQAEVYSVYAKYIQGRYPLNRKSGEDVPVQDFANFFRPGGKLDQFFREDLSPFFDAQTGDPISIDGQYLDINPDAIAELRKANRITQSFFDATGQMQLSFSIEPVAMSAGVMRAVINIEGQTLVYANGPVQSARMVWPNIVGGTESRVDISTRTRSGGSAAVSASGPWSWLRLMDKGSKGDATENSVNVGFYVGGGEGVTYRFQTDTEYNPIVSSSGGGFQLPETLAIAANRATTIDEIVNDISNTQTQ